MKKLPIILVISLLLISLAPACVANGIRIAPIQGSGYHITETHYREMENKLVVWGMVKNTSGWEYEAVVEAWVTEAKGYGDEIARYSESFGRLGEGEEKHFIVSFRKDEKWKDAERPLVVHIKFGITTL
jgi:hypothetical protein